MTKFTDIAKGPSSASARIAAAPLLDYTGAIPMRFQPETISVRYYAHGRATSLLQGNRVGGPGLLCRTFYSEQDDDPAYRGAPRWVQAFVREHAPTFPSVADVSSIAVETGMPVHVTAALTHDLICRHGHGFMVAAFDYVIANHELTAEGATALRELIETTKAGA